MLNVASIHNCYGCGVCSSSCGKNIISIELNEDGFYEPRIKETNKCVGCGICLDVCAFVHKERALQPHEINIKSWAAWSTDEKVRENCSSGGVGFEIGKQLIGQGYYAVGCRYDSKKERAEHYIATCVDEFLDSIGSKYIQSYTADAFKLIKRKGQKYLIVGTPCQIDSFRRMIRRFQCEENFILMDFYCHCVPSMHAWNAYLKLLEPQIGKVTYASWRNKPTGWHDSWTMIMKGEKGVTTSWMSKGDLFYKLFLGDICLGPQCQMACKYKWDNSSADIRIGDLWGKTYQNDQKGVSALVTFTEKGRNVVENLVGVTLVEHPFDVVAAGQMRENARQKELTKVVMWELRNNISLNAPMFKATMFAQRVITKLRSIL